jgi:8-oxo-dGTP pyrophosphatase MutT (NUDIX family)
MSLKPWRVLASRVLLRDRWLTVRADDCVTEDGATVAPYYVLEYPDWAHVAAFDHAGQILVVRQYRHALGRVCVELPGGIIDPGEAPLAAVQRELAEETGYTADRWEALGAFSPNPATHTNTLYGFLALGVIHSGLPCLDATEMLTHEFITVESLMRMIATGEFAQGLQVGTILLALQRLGRTPSGAE